MLEQIDNIKFENDLLIYNDKKIKPQTRKKLKTPNTQRRVYFVFPYVFKIDQRWSFESECEKALWDILKDEERKYFSCLLDSGIHWVKMQYYNFIDVNTIENCHLMPSLEEFEKVNKIINKYNLDDVNCEPYQMENCGITDEGEILIYDYGDY